MSQITAVFGWMLVINIVIYTLQAGFIVFARDWVTGLQVRLTGVPAEHWPRMFVEYLSRYKVMILVFNLAPWVGLKVVG